MDIFIFAVIILGILAVSDLIVGVSNDAVNFLNSAVGSRVAPRYIIIGVAGLGIIAGTLFSSGMMEVARKGIFHPEHFYFPELMTIFLAVMFADVILLDFFNTFSLPTSTTVSIVFDLLGAAVAVSLLKIVKNSESFADLFKYINSSKAFAIISGILLSIVVAFAVGAIIQFLIRLVFTFDYEKRVSRYGALWGGIAMTAITFFILIKGVKTAPFIDNEIKTWIIANTDIIIFMSFIVWTIIFQVLVLFKVNIFKLIVLIGTFALALAFAANDLVNFIGVPLAGLNAYQIASHLSNPSGTLMKAMAGTFHSNVLFLIAAGLIMIGAILFNRKARGVIKTSIDLGRQVEGSERFEATALSRIVVRLNISLMDTLNAVVPNFIIKAINKRFENADRILVDNQGQPLSFDLVRASVNLMVASMLISLATSWKLPLSTTYVTFMVLMGTSLSDRAWGRDSAVYRINGVMTVIGGWFFTAFMAFSTAATFAVIIYYGHTPAIVILFVIAAYFIFRTHRFYKEKIAEEEEAARVEELEAAEDVTGYSTLIKCMKDSKKFLDLVAQSATSSAKAFVENDRDKLKENKKELKKIKKRSNKIVTAIISAVRKLPEDELKKGKRYGKIMSSVQEIAIYVRRLVENLYNYVNNNHRPLSEEQMNELIELNSTLMEQLDEAKKYLESPSSLDEFSKSVESVNELIQKLDENQVNLLRMDNKKISTRGSLLFLEILSDVDNISNHVNNLISVFNKNFMSFKKM